MKSYVEQIVDMSTGGKSVAILTEPQAKEIRGVIYNAQQTSLQATIALIRGINAAGIKGTDLAQQLMEMLQPQKKSINVSTKRQNLFKADPADSYYDRVFRLGD